MPCRLAAVALLLVLAACSQRPKVALPEPAPPAATVFRNVSVFTAGDGDALLRGQDVVVVGEHIARVGPTGTVAVPENARIVAGEGRTLLPGLIDVHVHVGGVESAPWKARLPDEDLNLQRMLYAGITTVLDLGGPLDEARRFSRELASGARAGPELRYTGPHVAIRDGHPAAMVSLFVSWPVDRLLRPRLSFEVRDRADVERAVAKVAAHGGALVKITIDDIPKGASKLDLALARHAVERARAAGLRTIAHIGSNDDLEVALDAGVDALAHGVYREPLREDLVDRLAAAKVAVVPTVGVFTAIERLMHEGPEDFALVAELTDPEVRRAWARRPEKLRPEAIRAWTEEVHAARRARVENLALLHRKGVPLLVGSDSNNIGWPAGAALHRELDHFAEAGIPPVEVLRLATAANAAFLGLEDRGRIAAGLRADLLLVEGNPVEELASVHRIAGVFQRGREVRRTAPFGTAR